MEYFTLLNLKKEPFSNSSDPDFFYGAPQHLECLQKLESNIRTRRGLSVVIGDVGTGKSTLCRHLLRKLKDSGDAFDAHLIAAPSFTSPTDFLLAILAVLGSTDADQQADGKQLKEGIENILRTQTVEQKKTVVLLFDEGQKLPSFSLDILRDLLDFESDGAKLLQVVIFAQPKFSRLIELHTDLAGRMTEPCQLAPLDFTATRDLIRFRLQRASGHQPVPPRLFSFWALLAIYRVSKGNPRKIVMLCSRALISLIVENGSKVNALLVLNCTQHKPSVTARRKKGRMGKGLVFAPLALLLLATFLWFGNFSFRSLPVTNPSPQDTRSPASSGEKPLPSPAAAATPQARESVAASVSMPSGDGTRIASISQPDSPPARLHPPSQRQATAKSSADSPRSPERPKSAAEPAPSLAKAEPQSTATSPDLLAATAGSTPATDTPVLPATTKQDVEAPAQPAKTESAAGSADHLETTESSMPVTLEGRPLKLVAKRPMLGTLTIGDGDILSKMIARIYGRFNQPDLALVLRANPWIDDINAIPSHSIVRFPANVQLAYPFPKELNDSFWVLLGEYDTLNAAYRFLRAYPETLPPILLVPTKEGESGLLFKVVLESHCRSEQTARKLLARLPPGYREKAQVFNGWPEGTIVLTRNLGQLLEN